MMSEVARKVEAPEPSCKCAVTAAADQRVELHGAAMRLQSEPAKSAAFSFTLPEAWLQTELRTQP